MGQGTGGVGRDLQHVSQVAFLNDSPRLAVHGIPSPGTVHGQRHSLIMANAHDRVSLRETDCQGLLGPYRLHTGLCDSLDDVGADSRGRADRNDVRLLSVEHLLEVRVEVIVGESPSLSEYRSLLVVDVCASDKFHPLRMCVGRSVAVVQVQRPSTGDLVVEGAPHAAKADDRSAIGGHVGLPLQVQP